MYLLCVFLDLGSDYMVVAVFDDSDTPGDWIHMTVQFELMGEQ